MKYIMRLPGGDDIPINVDEIRQTHFSLTGRQALALLRILDRHRPQLEQQAQAEREAEFGRGPGYMAEIPRKIKRGDPRIGRWAVSLSNNYERPIEGRVTAILRYENGVEQLEISRKVYAADSPRPGTAVAWVHVDDADIL